MLQMQLDAFGPSDLRCLRTGNKITMLLKQESTPGDGSGGELQAALGRFPSVEASPATRPKKLNGVLKAFKSMRKKN
jgi:hypothetical protein